MRGYIFERDGIVYPYRAENISEAMGMFISDNGPTAFFCKKVL